MKILIIYAFGQEQFVDKVMFGCYGLCKSTGSDDIQSYYGYQLAEKERNQSCRPLKFQVIAETTNDQCFKQINKKLSVSNSITCFAQDTCSSYKNKYQYTGGGINNARCAFNAMPTTTDPFSGSYVTFSKCKQRQVNFYKLQIMKIY